MADGFGYGGFPRIPYPFWVPPPPPSFLATHPVDQTQAGFDPMIPHGSYNHSPSYGGDDFRSSFYAQPGNLGPRSEDSCKDMFSSQAGGYYPSSSNAVYYPPMAMPYSSATVSSLADMLIRNSQEPFYMPVPPSGVCATSNAFDLNRPGHYYSGYGAYEHMDAAASGPPLEPYVSVPSVPMSSFKTEASSDGSQTGSSHSPEYIQSSLHGSSVEPVNFNVSPGHGEATGHVKPLSVNPDLRDGTVGSTGTRTPWSPQPLLFNAKSSGSLCKEKGEGNGVSSLYQRPNTLVADSENGSSLKKALGDLNCDEYGSGNHFMVSSEKPSDPTMFSMGSESLGARAMKVVTGNAAQSGVNHRTPPEGSANQPSGDFQGCQKTCKVQKQLVDVMNRDKKTTLSTDMSIKGSSRSNADGVVSTGQSPVCDQGDSPSPASSTRVSSVVNAMRNLSEVLVNECFSNRSLLKPEQLENLDKVVENLTKCLKKITSNKSIAGEASIPTHTMHVSCPNVVDLNETPNVVAEDCQGFNVKPLDSFGVKESVAKDKNEMTQSIKNVLASKFPDGEENHPQTLLYKNLWLQTEAALCSSACLARYHRIKNETGNLKLQNREISADASTFMQEPFLNPQKIDSIRNNVEQETTESLIKHGSNCGNNVVTMSHDAPQNSRFNSAPVDAVLSLMSRSFTGLGQENHGNFKPNAQIPDAIQQEFPASTAEEKHKDVIDRFQILKQQETNRKLRSQDCPETRMGYQEDNTEASEMASIGKSSHMSDVMGRFELLKRREAEQVQKSLNSVDFDSDSGSDFESDSDGDQPRNRTKRCDYLWSGVNSEKETCANPEASAYDKGYESPTSDWEYVLKED